MLLFFTLAKSISVPEFVALTPLNGRRCWSTVRCLIRSIYPLISFSLYPGLIYPRLEANFSSQELPLFAAMPTFHDIPWHGPDYNASSMSHPILLTNGQLGQNLQSHKLMWFLWRSPQHNLHNLAKWHLDQSSWNLSNSFSSVALTKLCDE